MQKRYPNLPKKILRGERLLFPLPSNTDIKQKKQTHTRAHTKTTDVGIRLLVLGDM
jgi:hypothetical protein